MKFSEIYTYKKLSDYKGLTGKIPIRNPDLYLGIEVEVEKVVTGLPHLSMLPGSWKIVDDGSLKIQGKEFVTVPIQFRFLEVELRRLFGFLPKSMNFSQRTSIHVHMNARDFTKAELAAFIICYMLFERVLYRFSGKRWNNNYCIPIYDDPTYAIGSLTHLKYGEYDGQWRKYFGFNLCPLIGSDGESGRLGTIEFRHMAGTSDVNYIIDWCSLISSLKAAAKNLTVPDLIKIIQQGNIINLGPTIFGNWWHLLKLPQIRDDLDFCLRRTKHVLYKSGLLENKFVEKPKPKGAYIHDPFIGSVNPNFTFTVPPPMDWTQVVSTPVVTLDDLLDEVSNSASIPQPAIEDGEELPPIAIDWLSVMNQNQQSNAPTGPQQGS